MKQFNFSLLISALLILALVPTSCKKDKSEVPDPEKATTEATNLKK